MRSIKELLELLLKEVEEVGIDTAGLCFAVYNIFEADEISGDEEDVLYNYINENKPNYTDDGHVNIWGWERGSVKPRIEWLKKEIKKLK